MEVRASFRVIGAMSQVRTADQIDLAVVASRRGREWVKRVVRLCSLLGLALLAVDLRLGAVTMLREPLPTARVRTCRSAAADLRASAPRR